MARAQARRWNLVALDLGIDLATAAGEFMANVMASAAQWERRIIGQRTRDALAVKRSQGVRLGRPQMVPADLVARIRVAHRAGAGWSALARQLNAEGVPTAHGGTKWFPSTVRAVFLSAEAAA
jgi:DNA invertase Pin-like site-specific DNA recombinase